MSVGSAVARVVTAGLGLAPVASQWDRRSSDHLRVVAFHGIDDGAAFRKQLDVVASRYRPVSEDEVRASVVEGRALPERSVWVTFDDGHPSVVDTGMAELQAKGIPATMYVCPGLIETGSAPWWTVVEVAGDRGEGAEVAGERLVGRQLVRALKAVPDEQRRATVAELVAAAGVPTGRTALTEADLDRWLGAGFAIGNHTWDHPCLDQCRPDEQRQQITAAHEWLKAFRPESRPTFAYPNGDHTDHAESVLEELGYDLALLFDHRLVDPTASSLRISRVRLDAGASVSRTRAVLSGAHSALFGLRRPTDPTQHVGVGARR